MIEFLTTYWLSAVPTVTVGMFFLAALKKMRDEKAKSRMAAAPIPIHRK